MTNPSDRLYNLLPATYRIRDAAQGEQLRALLSIVSDELSAVEADIRGLYENWFIETSDEWVVSYIGDLLGVRGLNTLENTSFSQRAYVANTLYYRRRKGTAYVLATLAGDVTGWPAQGIEYFELLQTTQYLNHLRLFNTMPDLRKMNQVNLLDTPFDSLPHTADVRHINNRRGNPARFTRGRHNIPNIGIFLWRLQNYPLVDVTPRQAEAPHAYGYHFSPLGSPAPLFNKPTDTPLSSPNFGESDADGNEQLVPGPIRPFDFYRDLKAFVQKSTIQAEKYTARSSANLSAVAITDDEDPSQTGLETKQNEWSSYAGIDLTGQSNILIRYANADKATSLEIRLGSSSGALLGTCNLPLTAGWDQFETVSCAVSPTSGTQKIVLVYKADCHVYLNWFNVGADTANSRYYGPQRSLQITKDGNTNILPIEIICKDLRDWARPPAGKVAVDVARGRITFASGEEPTSLKVSYNCGFSADIGGGPYDRRERIAETNLPVQEFRVGAAEGNTTLAAALSAWENFDPPKPPAVIRIYDSESYAANLSIDLPANGMLVIDCENEERPTLLDAKLKVASDATTAEETAAFTLSGLLIEGSLETEGKLNLTITDCTLVPGISLDEDGYPEHPEQASLVVSDADVVDTAIVITRSILGSLELPEECQKLTISDSIVDAPLAKDADDPSRAAIAASADGKDPGPVTNLQRVTIFGQVHVKELELASEVIFVHSVKADRRQEGCVRFSYIPEDSQTPRRYHCQPDLAITAREKELNVTSLPTAEYNKIVLRLRPQFTRLRYGQPAFAQLAPLASPHFEPQNGGNEGGTDEIKTGAENGSEMGAFSLLQQPQRLANLQIALDEYLRFGLETGIFFVT